jgi:flagellar biosynthetic protein FliR
VEIPLPSAYGFGLILVRTLGLLLTVPLLSARTIPARIRVGLALVLAVAVWTGAGGPRAAPPESLWRLVAAAATETAYGALCGFAARAVLDAALAAGQVMSLSAGLGFGSLIDPHSGAESNAVAELLSVTAQGAALAAGLHREAVAWLARSALAFPPGSSQDLRQAAARAIWEASGSMALAVRVAFPVLGAVMVGHLVLGVLSRSASQLGLGNVGFTISILAGGGALYLVAPGAAELVARAAIAIFTS